MNRRQPSKKTSNPNSFAKLSMASWMEKLISLLKRRTERLAAAAAAVVRADPMEPNLLRSGWIVTWVTLIWTLSNRSNRAMSILSLRVSKRICPSRQNPRTRAIPNAAPVADAAAVVNAQPTIRLMQVTKKTEL